MKTTVCVLFALFGVSAIASAIPTAEEYANSLEMRFANGEAAASIRSSFETNELFTIHEIIPYCYDYTLNTNDLEVAIARYRAKIKFLDAILADDFVEVSSNVFYQTNARLWRTSKQLASCIRKKYNENPTAEAYEYWHALAPDLFPNTGRHGLIADKAFYLRYAEMRTKDARGFAQRAASLYQPTHIFQYLLNLDIYTNIFSRAELYAELSTNTQYNADAMFKYCLTDKSDFATNNIAIAEKQIWRNNFVLEITTHSCNLHTNAANRALNDAYTNRLAIIRAHYDAIPEPHLGMSGAELDEWRNRLGNTIDAYTGNISPFR